MERQRAGLRRPGRLGPRGAGHAPELVRQVATDRARLADDLAALPGVRMWPSAANFLLLRVPDGPPVAARLAAAGVAVRPCPSFPGLTADHLRVAVRDPGDNRRLVAEVSQALG